MQPDVRPGPPDPTIGPDSLSGALPALPQWLLTDPKPVCSRLPWPSCTTHIPNPLAMGEFTNVLKRAGICEPGVVPIPGASVLLPWGVLLSERLAAQVRAAYGRLELYEYAYPHVVAQSCFEPMKDLLDVDNCLLRVATVRGASRERGVLTPTGEQVIASHWRQMVNRPEVLPIRMFQRGRYFRPVSSAGRSGKGVFAALESPDVFELHCCHETQESALRDFQRIAGGLAELADALPLPQFSGLRPPWGNRSQLYEWVIGCDTPLPSGECVQTSALYFQGQQLSRRYDIGLGKGQQRRHTWQLDGFVSRRMLYAQLYLSVRTDGSLSVHPRLAPTQVAILARSQHDDELMRMRELVSALQSLDLRPSLHCCKEGKELSSALKHWRDRGVPLLLMFFGRRESGDPPRIRLLRTDTEVELDQPGDCSSSWLAQQVAHGIADVEEDAGITILRRARAWTSFATSVVEARQALSDRQCVIAPVSPTRRHVEIVSSWKMGELSGFAAAPEPQPCIFSGRPTWARALLTRRI